MGIQLGNCERFAIERIHFENALRDGVHIDGPAAYGLISDLSGETGDDVVALNAWDWEDFSLTFGAIHDIRIENIAWKPSGLWSQMRLLPGVKEMKDGICEECPIYNIHVRNVNGLHTVELYSQHNVATPGRDFSRTLGNMYNLFFEDMEMSYFPRKDFYTEKRAAFEVIANIYNLSFDNIRFSYPLSDESHDGYTAVGVGPMSYAYRVSDDPPKWEEFFRTEDICMVSGLSFRVIYEEGRRCGDIGKLLAVRALPEAGFGWVQSVYLDS